MSYMNLYVIVLSLHIIFMSISTKVGINMKSEMFYFIFLMFFFVSWNGMESGSSNNPTHLVTL